MHECKSERNDGVALRYYEPLTNGLLRDCVNVITSWTKRETERERERLKERDDVSDYTKAPKAMRNMSRDTASRVGAHHGLFGGWSHHDSHLTPVPAEPALITSASVGVGESTVLLSRVPLMGGPYFYLAHFIPREERPPIRMHFLDSSNYPRSSIYET